VTGAAGAIGSAIVDGLREQAEHVVAQDVDASALQQRHGAAHTVTTDGDLGHSGYRRALADLCRANTVDTVILAHGVDGAGPLHQLDDQRVRRVMGINATAVVALTQDLMPQLRERGGVVVIVDSQAGLQSEPNLAAYCGAKFALVGWARRLAPALAVDGVRLRLLCPGCTRTPLLLAAFGRFAEAAGESLDEALARRVSNIPVGRMAEVEETAAAAIYLADRSAPRPSILAATGGEVLL